MRSVVIVAIGAAFLAPACKTQQVCNASLPRPHVVIDLRAFVASHSGISGSLCPQADADPANAAPCESFALTDAGLLTSSTPLIYQGPRAGELDYFPPTSDYVLVVHLHALGTPKAGGSVQLIAHDRGPCSVLVYSPVVVSADGTPSTR